MQGIEALLNRRRTRCRAEIVERQPPEIFAQAAGPMMSTPNSLSLEMAERVKAMAAPR